MTVTTKRPKARFKVLIFDLKTNKSKGFSIYGNEKYDLEKIRDMLKKYIENLEKNENNINN